MQKHLSVFTAKGVTLLALTPELPIHTLTVTEKYGLKYPVLSDVGNKFVGQLGIVIWQPDGLRPVLGKSGHDRKARNGDDSFEVPIPATLLVDKKGVMRHVYIGDGVGMDPCNGGLGNWFSLRGCGRRDWTTTEVIPRATLGLDANIKPYRVESYEG